MNYTILNKDWNADPNAPMPEMKVAGNDVIIEFWVNYLMYPRFKENDKARLTFYNCYKYDLGGSNDEGYYRGQHRYKYEELPWGEFYQLDTNWEIDFPEDAVILYEAAVEKKMNHYIFFFRDESFECVSEGYAVEFFSVYE